MIDHSNQWLLQQIQQGSGNELVCICDTFFDDASSITTGKQSHLQLFSNRYNFYAKQSPVITTHFNDFDFSDIPPQSLNAFYLRIPKEKALCHYLINQAGKLLKPDGTLFLSGHKSEGIKTYLKKAKAYLQGPATEEKKQGASLICIQRSDIIADELDCHDYRTLRPITTENDITFFSKPGIFGWEKVDKGSQLLVNHLHTASQHLPKECSVLDLGCGYGFLALHAINQLQIKQLTATDNNAAALNACENNLKIAIKNKQLQTTYDVFPSNGGNEITPSFDLVLCNPPFHQGFLHDASLIQLFLSNAARLLNKEGITLFVVNDFIPLASHAKKYFKTTTLLTKAEGFSVFLLK